MSETFDADWLSLRAPFDAIARSRELARRLDAMLPARPRLLDLGAGTGCLFRWLAPIIRRAQVWTLVDASTEPIDAAFADIADWAEAMGCVVTFPGMASRRVLIVHGPFGAWRVQASVVDFAAAPASLPLDAVDAVVCNALLERVSAAWLERFCASLSVPLLACLDVDGRIDWRPRHKLDRVVASLFRRDQERDQGFGPALGRRAPSRLRAALTARGCTVTEARTDWRIPPEASDMLLTLVEMQAATAAERLPRQRDAIAAWQDARARQCAMARLAVRIGHRDSLALPGASATSQR
jgi:hypothetical protein